MSAVRPGYKQTEVGVIPEEWEDVPIGKLGRFKNGINKDSVAFGSGFPFVNLMDVFGRNHIGQGHELGLLTTSSTERAAYDLRAGDVLFVRSSVKPAGVGLTAVVLQDLPTTVFSGFLLRYRDNGSLDINFKKHVFYAVRFRNELIGKSSVSANTNINQSSLVGICIPLPPLPEQQAIAEALGDADGLIEALEVLIAKKRDIKQGAMQDLLTGHRRLPGFQGEWVERQLGSLGSFAKGSGVRKDEASSGSLPCVRYGELYTHHTDIVRRFVAPRPSGRAVLCPAGASVACGLCAVRHVARSPALACRGMVSRKLEAGRSPSCCALGEATRGHSETPVRTAHEDQMGELPPGQRQHPAQH